MIGKWKLILLTLIVGCACSYGNTDPRVSVSFSKPSISINQNVNLTVLIENSDAVPKFSFQEVLDVFDPIGNSSKSSYQGINGVFTTVKEYTFTLKPLKAGSYQFKNLQIVIDGVSFKANPISITITSQAPPAATTKQDPNSLDGLASQYGFFAIASLDKTSVYFGEKVNYHLDFYHRSHLFQVATSEIDFSAFWAEESPEKLSTETKMLGGRRFYMSPLKSYALYPVKSGDLTIDNVTVEFLSGSMFGGAKTVKSNPVKVTVKPLPAQGKPSDFSGAVGEFILNGAIDKDKIDQYSPITLTLFVSGDGNMATIQEFKFKEDPQFKIYLSKAEMVNINGVSGKLLEYIIVPNVAGTITLPEFYLPYFSPKKESYHVLKTNAISLEVSPTDSDVFVAESDKEVKEDIHYIKQGYVLHNVVSTARESGVLLWMTLLSIFGIFAQLLWHNRDRFLTVNLEKRALKQSFQESMTNLKSLQSRSSFESHEVEMIILGYLSVKTGQPLLGEVQENIKEACLNHGIEAPLVEEVLKLLDEVAFLAYSSSSKESGNQAILDKTISLLTRIHNEEKVS